MGEFIVSVILLFVVIASFNIGAMVERENIAKDCQQMKIFRISEKTFTCQEVVK